MKVSRRNSPRTVSLPTGAVKIAKYGNLKVTINELEFSSKKEGNRYLELKLLERAGIITNLELQPRFSFELNGIKICTYIADFSYTENGEFVVEDVKSPATITPVYRIKNKMMLAFRGIKIREV